MNHKCRYCGSDVADRSIWEHYQTCVENPDNRACFTCVYFLNKKDEMLDYPELNIIDCPVNKSIKCAGTFTGYVVNCQNWTDVQRFLHQFDVPLPGCLGVVK